MPFGLTNAPATCQNIINHILREHLDLFCKVFLDDILVYSNTKKAHSAHVRTVITEFLQAGGLYKPHKWELYITSTNCLGDVVSAQGVSMDARRLR